ncbi:GNAT family N-acetyltransferase [Streptomyces sp. NPDC059917]|uniref:GNAT family N-acetyltransferase n=1 Tax=Streptomyces sp. NPDC059917 TaxID=3347002 RepID=UPI0036556E47
MDGAAAAKAAGALGLIYAEVFAEPPYNESADDAVAAVRRLSAQLHRATFRAALARTRDGDPVGMAYGWSVPPDTGWWDELIVPVSAETRREDGHRTFGLMELAVRAPWRGRGVARRLHEALLEGNAAERVLLNVQPGSTAAVAAYRAWGYRTIGEAAPTEVGGNPREVMVLDLRG